VTLALKDQVAVVTGASSGIGRAIAIALGRQGATLCLLARRRERLEPVAELARADGARALSLETDLSREGDFEALALRVKRELGGADVLVHSAGVIALGSLGDTAAEELDRQYRVNVRGPYALTKALLPLLRARPGHIVFVNSSAALGGRARIGHYAATKHALKGLADSLREEVNADGIRVLTLFLGRTATPMQAAVHQTEGRPYHPEALLQPEDVAAMVVSALTLPRTAEVTDIHMRSSKNWRTPEA